MYVSWFLQAAKSEQKVKEYDRPGFILVSAEAPRSVNMRYANKIDLCTVKCWRPRINVEQTQKSHFTSKFRCRGLQIKVSTTVY